MVGVNRRIAPSASASIGSASGKRRSFRNDTVLLPMATTSFGWTMWSSRVSHAEASAGSSVPNFRQFVPYTASGSTRSRWSDLRTACPARPKNATPSWISDGCGAYFSRKTSASGWPDPRTGTRSSSPARDSSSPSSLISVMAFLR